MFQTPILLIIFKREETTKAVFEEIQKIKPSKLYVAADGPRNHVIGEEKLCQNTRAIIDTINWECEVKKLYREENVGLKKAVPEAITWFFSHENAGIILEDDCLPNSDFFKYCEHTLKLYQDDKRIFHIGGTNFQNKPRNNSSWYFSKYNHVWGWATWKRAWDLYDSSMEDLDHFISEAKKRKYWDSRKERIYWEKIFIKTKKGLINTWDYQWNYSMWINSGLSVTPNKNLVENIGFGFGATNTSFLSKKDQTKKSENLPDLIHENLFIRDKTADMITFKLKYWGKFHERIFHRLRKIYKWIIK